MIDAGSDRMKKRISLCTTYTEGITEGENQLIERSETNPFLKHKLKVKLQKHEKILKGYDRKLRKK
jgi:hypothetical protein